MSPRKPSTPRPKPEIRQPSDSRTENEPDLEAGEELEERIAPRLASNHNETRLADR